VNSKSIHVYEENLTSFIVRLTNGKRCHILIFGERAAIVLLHDCFDTYWTFSTFIDFAFFLPVNFFPPAAGNRDNANERH